MSGSTLRSELAWLRERRLSGEVNEAEKSIVIMAKETFMMEVRYR